jgi:hypothetical protein
MCVCVSVCLNLTVNVLKECQQCASRCHSVLSRTWCTECEGSVSGFRRAKYRKDPSSIMEIPSRLNLFSNMWESYYHGNVREKLTRKTSYFKMFPLWVITQRSPYFVSLSSTIKYMLRLCINWFRSLQCSAVQTSEKQFPAYFITELYDIYTLKERFLYVCIF